MDIWKYLCLLVPSRQVERIFCSTFVVQCECSSFSIISLVHYNTNFEPFTFFIFFDLLWSEEHKSGGCGYYPWCLNCDLFIHSQPRSEMDTSGDVEAKGDGRGKFWPATSFCSVGLESLRAFIFPLHHSDLSMRHAVTFWCHPCAVFRKWSVYGIMLMDIFSS